MARFSIDVRVDGTQCEVIVGGDIDRDNADQLSTVGLLAIDKSRAETVVVDLGGVGAFDSAGVDALMRIRTACQAHAKDVYLRDVPAQLRDVVTAAGLTALLPEPVDGRD